MGQRKDAAVDPAGLLYSTAGWSIFFAPFIVFFEVIEMVGRKKWRVNLLQGRTTMLIFFCVLFLMGGVAGCVTAGLAPASDVELSAYITGLLRQFGSKDPTISLFSVVWNVFRVPLLAVFLSVTALGLIGLPVLVVLRGFALNYAVALLYRLMGIQGLYWGGCLFGLSALLWLPALLELCVSGLSASYGILRRVSGDGRYPLMPGRRYLTCCGVCGAAFLLCAGLEYAVIPRLLRLMAHRLLL